MCKQRNKEVNLKEKLTYPQHYLQLEMWKEIEA